GASQITATATLNDYAHPNVEGTYQATLDSVDLEPILNDAPLPSGVIRLVGSAHFQSDPTKALIESLSTEGNITSASLRINTATVSTEVRNMSADYQSRAGDLDIRNLHAEVLGGALSGSYLMHDLTAVQRSELQVAVKHVDLSAIQSITHSSIPKQ